MQDLFQNSVQTLHSVSVTSFYSVFILRQHFLFVFMASRLKQEALLTVLEQLTNHYIALLSPLFHPQLQIKKITFIS